MSFQEAKPRKAKYSFEIRMSPDILSEGLLFAAINEILQTVPESPETFWKEYRNGMGTYSLTIYINDEAIYNQLKTAITPYIK